MYRRTFIKFLIALGTICAVFALVCCSIAFVRVFLAGRQIAKSQKTLAAQTEEIEEIRASVKKASRQIEKENEEIEEKIRLPQEDEPEISETPNPGTPTPAPTATLSANRLSANLLSGNNDEKDADNEPNLQNTVSETHVVAIDPGHQGPHVDMSDTEPIGPGSTEMKAKATSGTSGAYSGQGEYQLNLDVSLKLQEILENRGYRVIMTRTDNNTAISNAERALLATEEGAEIYVRIHANGSDDHSVQGALSMCPSQDNPYVPQLYEDSLQLSTILLESYCEATNFENRGVQFYDNMTGINWSSVPVTILEMGFMTNEHDDLAMADSQFQQTMAEGIADGIDRYFAQ